MAEFQLHPSLVRDTVPIRDLPLSKAVLMNDARYPWIILVPRRPEAREIYQLTHSDRIQLLEESCVVAEALAELFKPDKINVGALGNLVPQLHVHHIARFRKDPAWPGPVWGHSVAEPYLTEALVARIGALQTYLVDVGQPVP